MSRVALVTGGTRGIGAAISIALKNAGYKVAANFAGNEEKAKAFEAETGIPVFKWDVSNYQACVDGIAAVEAALGPWKCWSTMPVSRGMRCSTRWTRTSGARSSTPTSPVSST